MTTETKKLGIEQTKDIILYVEAIAGELNKSKQGDGKITMLELVTSLAKTAPEAIKAMTGVLDVPNELKDLDDKEKKELLEMSLQVILNIASVFGVIGD